MTDGSVNISDLQHSLSQTLPGFLVPESNIEILSSPTHFYETLLVLGPQPWRDARHTLNCIGTGPLERVLVHKLHSKLNSSKDLSANLLFDYHRAQRVDSSNSTSVTVLHKILQERSLRNRFCLYLYRCPQYQDFYDYCLQNRLKEIFGVQHTKLYAFDDTVVISGANLSHSYFTDRSDRYIRVKGRGLADYIHDVISKIGLASFKWTGSDRFQSPSTALMPHSFDHVDYSAGESAKISDRETGTWVFPAMQFGVAGIHQDKLALCTTLKALDSPETRLYFASGYLNITPHLRSQLVALKAHVHILTAAPSANGFHNASGLARHIPNVYSTIQAQILELCRQHDNIKMAEFDRPGWTYHKKGVWIQPSKEEPPILTTIGSSNFGYRSARRDLECQLYILSSERDLRLRLAKEVSESMQYMSPVTPETFKLSSERRPSLGIRLVSRLIRTWL